MHILVIEDEEQLCRSIAEGLRMDGYETDTCLDGDEGLELCTTENYDLKMCIRDRVFQSLRRHFLHYGLKDTNILHC